MFFGSQVKFGMLRSVTIQNPGLAQVVIYNSVTSFAGAKNDVHEFNISRAPFLGPISAWSYSKSAQPCKESDPTVHPEELQTTLTERKEIITEETDSTLQCQWKSQRMRLRKFWPSSAPEMAKRFPRIIEKKVKSNFPTCLSIRSSPHTYGGTLTQKLKDTCLRSPKPRLNILSYSHHNKMWPMN